LIVAKIAAVVAIRPSSSKQIESLLAELASASAVSRETALARLTVIGARAVERLLAAAATGASVEVRTAAWRALEAIGDARALEPALALLAQPQADAAEGAAAVAVAREFLRGRQSVAAVDRLTAVALDRTRPEPVRLAALRALRTLDRATIAPLLASLAGDPQAPVRAEASAPRPHERLQEDPAAIVTRAADDRLPDDAARLKRALGHAGNRIALPLLLKIVERVRDKEAAEPASRRAEWTMTRAAAHVALAARGSRLALYDLRESLDAAPAPLPVEFLSALSMVGDASCLESIAAAHARARDDWWRGHLAEAFRTIVARERLTKRHAALKRVEKRWPRAIDALMAPGAARPRRPGGPGGLVGSG
jgi:HEAT repeat protein